ncbi:DUF4232 domain-containing protein [Ferrimicrobium sp.]|uniref:DUF4232 domain-containing protein n=1 Tax=Ferrimicrobium sp. TaxID=2926050 RepID=UPI0026240541|nr:DUF4232 domain-containing protein [Ferrimicrobium sp.]
MKSSRRQRERRLRPTLVGTAVVLGAGLALAACGSSSQPTSNSSSSTTKTHSSKAKTKTTKSTNASTVDRAGRCRSTNLVAHMVSVEGAAGSTIRTYTLVNTGTNTCTLYGYPGLQLLGAGGTKLATHVIRTPAPERSVKLAHGASVSFLMQFADSTGYGNESCPTSSSLEITPPNDYHYLTLTGPAGTLQAFGGTVQDLKCGTIEVQPVAAESS